MQILIWRFIRTQTGMVLLGHDITIHIYARQICSVICWLYLSWSLKGSWNERPMKRWWPMEYTELFPGGSATGSQAAHNKYVQAKGKSSAHSYIWSAPWSAPVPPSLIIYISDLDADVTIKASTFRRWHPTPSQSKLREGSNARLPKFTYFMYIYILAAVLLWIQFASV